MSEIYRKIGEIGGKMANKDGFLSGAMSAMDPALLAKAVNENASLLGEVMAQLDPKVLADVINANPDFMAKIMKNLDAAAVANALNKNQRFVTHMIENTDPNVFSRSVNVVFNKIRKATYRPGITPTEELEGLVSDPDRS